MTTLRVLWFAWLRERVGRAEEELEVPAEITTVGALRAWLARPGSPHAAAFAPGAVVRCAVNQEFRPDDAPVAEGDEVAFFPPVTGG